jgi:replicative DNA helicase
MSETEAAIRSNAAPSKKFKVLQGGSRELPHSLEAEEHLLSCCLLDGNGVVKRCLEQRLEARHFYNQKHGIVYERIVDLYNRQLPIDVSVLAEELKSNKQLDAIGGYAFLMQVSSLLPTSGQTGYFLEKVIEQAILRRIIRDGTETVESTYGYSGGELLAFTGATAAKFQAIADFVLHRARKVTQRDAATAALEEAMTVAAGKVDKTRWLHFPLAKLDSGFLPIDTRQEDWFNIIAAPPSGAKSSCLRWLAGHWLAGGKRGVVFLLETSRKRWLQALAATFAGVNLRILEDEARVHPEAFAVFTKWMQAFEDWMEERLWIFDDVVALEDISRVTRDVHRQIREREIAAGLSEAEAHGLDFVVGDYLQIVSTRRQFMKRTEELAHITRSIKQLHRTLDVPGFWGAQITREARNEGRPPTLADLGESKSLEENADRVLFLHVPPLEDSAGPDNRSFVPMNFIQRKSRNGPKDVYAELEFHRPFTNFRDPQHKGFAQVAAEPRKGKVSKKDFE